MKILVLGSSGMLGNAVFRFFSDSNNFEVFGTIRNHTIMKSLPSTLQSKLIKGVDAENMDDLIRVFVDLKPNVVINCIGLVKQRAEADDPLDAISINALMPHRITRLCAVIGARFVHMSTDCVFSGSKGMYKESDFPDATDLYGRSKFLGEVDYPNAITLRTSIIGHELEGSRSLVGWFLSQQGSVKGFKKAIFSGMPTVEVARLIRDHILPNPKLHGLYHVSADPIDKYELLKLVAATYNKDIEIEEDNQFAIDRSLDSSRFRSATGFQPRSWPTMVHSMRDFG